MSLNLYGYHAVLEKIISGQKTLSVTIYICNTVYIFDESLMNENMMILILNIELFFSGEREHVQKKTFTKWVNSHLARINCRITDLYTDLRDGKYLIKLLEILSGERLPRPTKGKMRIHCLENVDKALSFLYEQRVQLENMGAHDIVDGHARLTLGLIWTIILRFQIQDITTVRILIHFFLILCSSYILKKTRIP